MSQAVLIDNPTAGIEILRREVMTICGGPEGGHLGGSLSALDMMAAIHLRAWPSTPCFVLSKGHAALGLYTVLWGMGEISLDQLRSFCRSGSLLSTHTNCAVDGVAVSTGSLGHGLGIAVGWALAQAVTLEPVYVVLGDGETQEGSIAEAARVAANQRLGNLIALVDMNGAQQTGKVENINALMDAAAWWQAMGWNVVMVDNGNSLPDLTTALDTTPGSSAPSVLLCRTTKGHGAGELAGHPSSHFVTLTKERLDELLTSVSEVPW